MADLCERCFKQGASVNTEKLYDTALSNAALNGHEECLKTSIKSGADVNYV